MSTRVVGADGTKGGWITVALESGRLEDVAFCPTVDDILKRHSDSVVVALDIPVGEVTKTPRAADSAARKFIPGRTSSVFPTPLYVALQASSYPQACQISVTKTGQALSKQSWELRHKINEATAAARVDDRIIEVHPEVSFSALNGGQPLARKKSYNGFVARLNLLRDVGIHLPATVPGGDTAAADDILDAAAAAWSADRKRRGEAVSLPEPVVDFAIWY